MHKWITRLLPASSGHTTAGDESGPAGLPPADYTLIVQAHREWLAAKACFNEVNDPALVDHAVHVLAAAENRYRCLLRKARQRVPELSTRGD